MLGVYQFSKARKGAVMLLLLGTVSSIAKVPKY